MLPDSFQPYLLNDPIGGVINFTTSGTTDLLVKGQLGIFTCPPQTGEYGSAIAAATTTPCIIASGSWHTIDNITPFWGGLLEPDYTKIIDWKLVNAFFYSPAQVLQNQIVAFGWNLSSGSTVGPAFFCGTSYQFQLEMMGNPALNFLDHQYYKTLSAVGACCGTGCTSGCTTDYVDAASIMLQWKDDMNQDPYWPSFANPQVYIQTSAGTAYEVFSAYDVQQGRGSIVYVPNTTNPISVVASFKVTIAYTQTVFDKCTFSPSDHYEVEPLYLNGSLFTQDSSPCAVNTTINTSVPNMYTEIQAPRQVRGIGQIVVRNLQLWNQYKQENFTDSMSVDSLRMREIENDWTLPNVTLSALYDSIYLRWNIFRPWNSQSITDNDQYALVIYVPTGTDVTPFTSLIDSCLTLAGNYVQMETL